MNLFTIPDPNYKFDRHTDCFVASLLMRLLNTLYCVITVNSLFYLFVIGDYICGTMMYLGILNNTRIY